MRNDEVEAAWDYHNRTKHSPLSVRSSRHCLDWENQPLPFKIYSTLDPIPLPRDLSPSSVPALSAISATSVAREKVYTPDLKTLARLFYFSAGITKRKSYPGGEILFRAASCTGALYHIDLYLVCGPLPDIEPGVYHFGVQDFALRRLRLGDYREILVRASAEEPAVTAAPAVVICTGTFWRNAWKYQTRSYRHSYWDSGTILANLLAITAAHGVPAKLVGGFVDTQVNQLLDLDTEREVSLSLMALGHAPGGSVPPAPQVRPLCLETVPLSKREVDYPAIRAMHQASSLTSESEAAAWRGRVPAAALPEPSGPLFPLQPASDEAIPRDPIEQAILRRGSTREFAREAISYVELSTMLHGATRGIPADFLDPTDVALNDLYLIVHAVDGLPSGTYVYRQDREALELCKRGDFRREGGYLGLEQDLPADASVDIFFLAELKPILERFGNRGYRVAQLEAAIMGGKLYLAAYAQRLGATGLTFYDEEVTAFFSPHAAGKSVMFLMALGKSASRRVK